MTVSQRRSRTWLLLLVLVCGFPLSDAAAAARRSGRAAPKLVVLLVIDQFRQDFLTRFAPFFGEGGFRRLMEQGADFTSARYQHAATYTGPGHACIVTGTYGGDVRFFKEFERFDRSTVEVVEQRQSPGVTGRESVRSLLTHGLSLLCGAPTIAR